MKQRILLFMALLAMVVSTARAQSKIDDLVDHFSTSTTSKYTSAVERNPKTREVVKVVKILEMNYCDATPFVNAFKKDTSNGELSETRSGNDLVMTRTMQGKKLNLSTIGSAFSLLNVNVANAQNANAQTVGEGTAQCLIAQH